MIKKILIPYIREYFCSNFPIPLQFTRDRFFLRFPIITDKFHKRSYLFFFLSFIDAKNIVSRRLATRISEEEGFAPRVT